MRGLNRPALDPKAITPLEVCEIELQKKKNNVFDPSAQRSGVMWLVMGPFFTRGICGMGQMLSLHTSAKTHAREQSVGYYQLLTVLHMATVHCVAGWW